MNKLQFFKSLPRIVPYIIIFGIISLVSCKTVTQEKTRTDASSDAKENELLGEWINFNGWGGFEIKTISNTTEISKEYDEWGTLRQHRTSVLNIESDNDASSAKKGIIIGPKAEWDYLAGGKKPVDLKWTTADFLGFHCNPTSSRAVFTDFITQLSPDSLEAKIFRSSMYRRSVTFNRYSISFGCTYLPGDWVQTDREEPRA